jgi:hypothetical protein
MDQVILKLVELLAAVELREQEVLSEVCVMHREFINKVVFEDFALFSLKEKDPCESLVHMDAKYLSERRKACCFDIFETSDFI